MTAADHTSSSDHTMGTAFSGIQFPSSLQDPTTMTSSRSVTWIFARNTTVARIFPLLSPCLGMTSSTLMGMYTPRGALASAGLGASGSGTARAAGSAPASGVLGATLRGTMVLAAVPDSSATGVSATGVDLGMGYAWMNSFGSSAVEAAGAVGFGPANLGSPGLGAGSVWSSPGIHRSTALGRVITTL